AGAGADALEEVGVLVIALIQIDFVGSDCFGLEGGWAGGALKLDPAIGAFETHTAGEFAGDLHQLAIGIEAVELKIRGGIVGPLVGEVAPAFNLSGARQFGAHAPVGHVDHVGTPIGDLPARVVEIPAEGEVAAPPGVGSFGGGAKPQVVVEVGGRGG